MASRKSQGVCYGDPESTRGGSWAAIWWYVAWKHFILIWAVYSSFFTPMEFGFFRGLPEKIFLLDIAGQLAFLIDIAVRFRRLSRPHSYCVVYDRTQIAIRYLKSRFILDLLGCFPWDYIYKVSGRKEVVRYLLWIRLSRAFRVTEFFERMEKNIRVNYLFTRIAKLLVVELYCTHTAACIFYYLATTMPPSKEGYTWIGSLKMGDYAYSDFRHIDLWKRYITSLYFAIVTMATVGYGDIHAVNVREMIFIMIYVSFDMILGAYLLGNMTALIVKDQKQRDHLRLQYDRSYADPSVLHHIPTTIRTQISITLYEQFIQKVPLFKGCSSGFIKQIATKVHEEFFLPGELVMEQGDVADQLYFVYQGELHEITREDGDTEETIILHTYSTFGEVSFLCNMPETSIVQAHEFCKVLRLDKKSFTDILKIFFLDGRTIFNNLIEVKDSSIQRKLLESDFNLTIGNQETELAMRMNCAAYDGHLDLLKGLIGSGADPNKTDYDGRSPLHISASKGYVDISHFLVEQGVNINLQELDLLKRVLACGINPNAKNYDQRTPLHIAASEGLYTIAELLVEAGASVLSKDRWGNTPLHCARTGGNRNMIKMLDVAKVSLS
ncbi:RmlC-like jelly roll fold [Sesbania bispinosa]|nr:RmlC-like jelly roll fold [Sesbania bispinosa]